MNAKKTVWVIAWKTSGPDPEKWTEEDGPLRWNILNDSKPIVWQTGLASNRRLFIPAEHFTTGEIIQVSLVF